jgi:hypothetical protein
MAVMEMPSWLRRIRIFFSFKQSTVEAESLEKDWIDAFSSLMERPLTWRKQRKDEKAEVCSLAEIHLFRKTN